MADPAPVDVDVLPLRVTKYLVSLSEYTVLPAQAVNLKNLTLGIAAQTMWAAVTCLIADIVAHTNHY